MLHSRLGRECGVGGNGKGHHRLHHGARCWPARMVGAIGEHIHFSGQECVSAVRASLQAKEQPSTALDADHYQEPKCSGSLGAGICEPAYIELNMIEERCQLLAVAALQITAGDIEHIDLLRFAARRGPQWRTENRVRDHAASAGSQRMWRRLHALRRGIWIRLPRQPLLDRTGCKRGRKLELLLVVTLAERPAWASR